MEYSIKDALAPNGKDRAMLSEREELVYNFFVRQGRKFNVSIAVTSKAPEAELRRATSSQNYDEIIQRYGSEITVKAH